MRESAAHAPARRAGAAVPAAVAVESRASLRVESLDPLRMLPMRRSTWLRLGPLCAGIVLLAGSPARASYTGVCPDGSIYVVHEERQIPCREAKPVDAHGVPPIRPEYLPTPYTWKVWNERHSPNNPYNVLDDAKQVRELEPAPPGPQGAAPQAGTGTAAPPGPAPVASAPVALGLGEAELRDLFQ